MDVQLIYNEPGLITPDESWCITSCGYLYGPCDTPQEVIWEMIFEWQHDEHIVG